MSGAMALDQQELPMIDVPGRQRGLGGLECRSAEGRRALPLSAVSVSARVADRVAEVLVEQRFVNPFTEALEATYIFPLAGGAAVSRFELQVGARVLKGLVQERGEARRQYQQALQEGRRAALLEQERDDVFTVQVGNLPPGEEVTVRLAYSEKLPFYEDGMTELRLPLVVAPRYIAGLPIDTPEQAGRGVADDTDLVPDASRITPPRLAPGFDPKVALRISVELLHGVGGAGAPFAELGCSQHATRAKGGPELMTVSLASEKEPLDRDFVLRWRVAGERVSSSLIVHRADGGDGFALLSVVPPRREIATPPRDVVFVLDRSGSMGGEKMASAARACSMLLGTLGPRDRFALQAYDNVVEWMDGQMRFCAADEAGIAKGDKWLRGVDARGGTETGVAMHAALDAVAARPDGAARAAVVVLLTDGEIGAESQVLAEAQARCGQTRIFTVGIDTAVNSGFLKRLAQLGRGTATFVEPGAQLEDALRAVGREIGQPLIVDLEVHDAGAGLIAGSGAPSRMPDLFAGRAAGASFRLAAGKGAPGAVRVTGRFLDGQQFEELVPAREVPLAGLSHVWARARVSDLEDRYRIEQGGREALKKEIIELALRHTLLTRFTAFVVVDQSEIVNKDGTRRQVTQPVEMPKGWDAAPPELSAMTLAAPRSPAKAARAMSAMGAMGMGGGRTTNAGFVPPAAKAEAALEADDELFDASVAPEELEESSGHIGGGPGYAPAPPSKPPPPPIGPAVRLQLATGIAELKKALAQADRELQAGRAPDASALQALRARLLKLLTDAALAVHLPLLERYLRATLFRLLDEAQARPGPLASQLLRAQQPELDAALAEADALLGPDAGGRRFWEASV